MPFFSLLFRLYSPTMKLNIKILICSIETLVDVVRGEELCNAANVRKDYESYNDQLVFNSMNVIVCVKGVLTFIGSRKHTNFG